MLVDPGFKILLPNFQKLKKKNKISDLFTTV